MSGSLAKLMALAVLLAAGLAWGPCDAAASCGGPEVLDDGWEVASAAEAGLDEARLCALEKHLSEGAGLLAGIHGVLVARHGKLAFEAYRTGFDHPWGQPAGTYVYDAGSRHDMRSISKSVVSLLVGIALDRHLIASLDDSVFDYLPDYADLRTPEKAKITIENLLSMSSGLMTNELVPYFDPNNTERLTAEADDPVRFVLERRLLDEPGTCWAYSGGSTMLLAKILEKVTGKALDEFARQSLFEPLGIETFEWLRLRRSGEVSAYGGLRLRPRDAAKLGRLLLDRGEWNGRRIVSEAWLSRSTRARFDAWHPDRYALHWWSGRTRRADGADLPWTAAVGIGGQRLFVMPDLDLVVVVTGGLYDQPQQDKVVRAIFEEDVAAAAR